MLPIVLVKAPGFFLMTPISSATPLTVFGADFLGTFVSKLQSLSSLSTSLFVFHFHYKPGQYSSSQECPDPIKNDCPVLICSTRLIRSLSQCKMNDL